MLEVLLLMLATGVQSAAALDGPSGSTAMTPAIEAPVVATAPTPQPEPAPAPVVEPLADEDPPEPPEAQQQTSALGLPMFPPASAAPVAAQPIPSFPPVANTAPATPAPVVTAPQPTPQPVIAIPTPQSAQPAPQPVIAMPQPTTPAPSGQLAFLAPKTTNAAPVSPGLVAEPQVPTGRFLTALEVRPILNATKGNWIAVREYAGKDLLYVTHLWSWRCGLAELKIGLNGGAPEVWPLPPCHPEQAQAAAILEGDGNPYREFGLRSVQLIEVVLTYDDLTTDRVRFNRGGVVIP